MHEKSNTRRNVLYESVSYTKLFLPTTSSTHLIARGFYIKAFGSSSFYGNGAMFYEFTKVLRRRSSSHAKVGLIFDSSSHFEDILDFIYFFKRNSYSESWCMKVALISRSGRLLLRNSRLFSSDHLYLRMMYAARAQVARLWPLTECTSTDSVASKASSMKSNIALEASSFGSNSNCEKRIELEWN